MREIYIYRHGETDYNRLGKIQGQGIDSSLNDLGKQQAQAFFEYYREINFDRGYHSALQRSRQTIQPFIDDGLTVTAHPELNEISWGDWEGQAYNPQIRSVYSEMIEAWTGDNPDYKLPNGESANELISRLGIFWNQLLADSFETALICSHGRAIRALMTVIFDEHPGAMEQYGHSNTGLFLVRITEHRPTLILSNDVSHLENITV